MAYEPTNWKTGDVVTSAKLNKIEQGIADGGVLVVNRDSSGTLDKTWQEILDADVAFVVYTDGDGNHRREFVSELYILNGAYYMGTVLFIPGELENITTNEYSVESPDGYPVYD